MEPFLHAMYSRFACKRFRPDPLKESDIQCILECGRLSPSSFGLEGWAFHGVVDPEKRIQLFHACFEQEPVRTAPISVVLAAYRAQSFDPHSAFVQQRASRFPSTLEEFSTDYQGYYDYLKTNGRLDCWSRSQCYIAAANMMTGAAYIGIQSCAIEGFKEEDVLALLGLDAQAFQIALVIPFGYPDEPVRPKIREPLDMLVTWH